jgi:hypothetical protein
MISMYIICFQGYLRKKAELSFKVFREVSKSVGIQILVEVFAGWQF